MTEKSTHTTVQVFQIQHEQKRIVDILSALIIMQPNTHVDTLSLDLKYQ